MAHQGLHEREHRRVGRRALQRAAAAAAAQDLEQRVPPAAAAHEHVACGQPQLGTSI